MWLKKAMHLEVPLALACCVDCEFMLILLVKNVKQSSKTKTVHAGRGRYSINNHKVPKIVFLTCIHKAGDTVTKKIDTNKLPTKA